MPRLVPMIFRQVKESFIFSLSALHGNLLRTTLSLLGVSVGIFSIIAVFTLVDSLERSINKSLSFLGRTNVDIRRFPFDFGPDIPWWEYFNRPFTNYEEFELLQEMTQEASGSTIFAINRITPKYGSNSVAEIRLMGVSCGHIDVYDDFESLNGRHFTPHECHSGRNVAILGHRTRNELFGGTDPIGKSIKIKGLKFVVIGYMEEQGAGLLGGTSQDENVYIPFKSFTKFNYVGKGGLEPLVTIKGKESNLAGLEFELKGLLRQARGLKPMEKDNFSIVRQEAILNSIGSFFQVLSLGGWLIGGFSILIGGFGIANIMFVSVKERTNLIGIQKALGAKDYFILLQFLFEAILLSLAGGAIGLLLVFLLSLFDLGTLELILTTQNVFTGLLIAAFVGSLAGIIPASVAAKMDPVEAIRTI